MMLTPEEREKIMQLSSEGWTSSRIAKELGFDPKTVRGVLRKNGDKVGNSVPPKLEATQDSEVDGKLASRVIGRFNQGERPEAIVEKEEVSPDVILALHRKWLELRDAGSTEALAQEVKRLKEKVGEMEQAISYFTSRIKDLEEGAAGDPLWDIRRRLQCPHCNGEGTMSVRVKCVECYYCTHVVLTPDGEVLQIREDVEQQEKMFPGGPRVFRDK